MSRPEAGLVDGDETTLDSLEPNIKLGLRDEGEVSVDALPRELEAKRSDDDRLEDREDSDDRPSTSRYAGFGTDSECDDEERGGTAGTASTLELKAACVAEMDDRRRAKSPPREPESGPLVDLALVADRFGQSPSGLSEDGEATGLSNASVSSSASPGSVVLKASDVAL